MEKEKARVWLYTRDLDLDALAASIPDSGSGNTVSGISGPGQIVKHWATVLEYLQENGQVDCKVIYEANNEGGLLKAKKRSFREKILKDEWENKPGYHKEYKGEFPTVDEERAEKYCQDFNEKKIKYDIVKQNCQIFVKTFLFDNLIEASISFPCTAEELVEETKTWGGSLASLGSGSLSKFASANMARDFIVSARGTPEFQNLVITTIKNIDLNGLGSIKLLEEGPVKEWMKKVSLK